MTGLFAQFDLPWRSGSYARSNSTLNPDMTSLDTAGLLEEYSQKAVHLSGVDSRDTVYLPDEEPYHVDPSETPVALASVGPGRLGYVGYVNREDGTRKVVLRMFGVSLAWME